MTLTRLPDLDASGTRRVGFAIINRLGSHEISVRAVGRGLEGSVKRLGVLVACQFETCPKAAARWTAWQIFTILASGRNRAEPQGA